MKMQIDGVLLIIIALRTEANNGEDLITGPAKEFRSVQGKTTGHPLDSSIPI